MSASASDASSSSETDTTAPEPQKPLNENLNINEEETNTADDVGISQIIRLRSTVRHKWPIQRNRIRQFSNLDLTSLRLYKSQRYDHFPETVPLTLSRKHPRLPCALCSRSSKLGKRKTSKQCNVCKVPLCVTLLRGETRSHFELWHSVRDLRKCSEICHGRLVKLQEERGRLKASEEERRREGDEERKKSLKKDKGLAVKEEEKNVDVDYKDCFKGVNDRQDDVAEKAEEDEEAWATIVPNMDHTNFNINNNNNSQISNMGPVANKHPSVSDADFSRVCICHSNTWNYCGMHNKYPPPPKPPSWYQSQVPIPMPVPQLPVVPMSQARWCYPTSTQAPLMPIPPSQPPGMIMMVPPPLSQQNAPLQRMMMMMQPPPHPQQHHQHMMTMMMPNPQQPQPQPKSKLQQSVTELDKKNNNNQTVWQA